MSSTLKHDSIGEVHGRTGDHVVQFLGIKYATLKDPFYPSELVSYAGGEAIDGTKFGPTVIYPPGALENEFTFIQKSLPTPEFTASAVDALSLNITVPLSQGQVHDPSQRLPVFVFVHGGGFALGSSAWPHYDQGRLVKLSNELGLPVIGVSINYRVGAPGFLTSAEMREAGYVSNNGLKDQVNAFRWVKKFIAGFGGDPKNVTFVGESAGSISGNMLLHSKEPLFKRYISMSGTNLMLKPLPPPVSEFVYSVVVKALSLDNLSPSERVKALVQTPPEKLLMVVPPTLPVFPVMDEDFLNWEPSFARYSADISTLNAAIQGRSWCEDLLIGDCQFDGSILGFMLGPRKVGLAQSFCSYAAKALSSTPHGSETLLDAYGISPDMTDDQVLKPVLRFANDISWFAPTASLARSWHGKAYMYHFNEPNPWEGPWKGEAGHVLDVAYLFQNFNEFLNDGQKDVARKFAGDFISFTNGKAGWPEFAEGSEGAQVYGPSAGGLSGVYVEGFASESSGRSQKIYKLADQVGGLDLLANLWSNFLSGQV